MLPLHPDYRNRTRSYMLREANQPFVWGERDCALFAAGVIDALYDTDFRETFAGTYKSGRGALLRVYRKGGFVPFITDTLQLPAQEITGDTLPTIGDLVFTRGRKLSSAWDGCLGVYLNQIVVFKSRSGVVQQSFKDCSVFWSTHDAHSYSSSSR